MKIPYITRMNTVCDTARRHPTLCLTPVHRARALERYRRTPRRRDAALDARSGVGPPHARAFDRVVVARRGRATDASFHARTWTTRDS